MVIEGTMLQTRAKAFLDWPEAVRCLAAASRITFANFDCETL
jgi:hypothetical protein